MRFWHSVPLSEKPDIQNKGTREGKGKIKTAQFGTGTETSNPTGGGEGGLGDVKALVGRVRI